MLPGHVERPAYRPIGDSGTDSGQLGRSLKVAFLANAAPLGYLRDFLIDFRLPASNSDRFSAPARDTSNDPASRPNRRASYPSPSDPLIGDRLRGALAAFVAEAPEPGRFVGDDARLAHIYTTGDRDLDLDDRWSDPDSLFAAFFMAAALLYRLERSSMISPRDLETLETLCIAGDVDEARCDVLTQILRLQRAPWRETALRGRRSVRVLDALLPWFSTGSPESDETVRAALGRIAKEDRAAGHLLNPGFAYDPVRGRVVGLVRGVGRDGVNRLGVLDALDEGASPSSLLPRAWFEASAEPDAPKDPGRDLEDPRLHRFTDPESGRSKVLVTWLVAGGDQEPVGESRILDFDALDSSDPASTDALDARETVSVDSLGPAWRPMRLDTNRRALLDAGVPVEAFDDPLACVKDFALSRCEIVVDGERRLVHLWEFRSKSGGGRFLDAPDYQGRFLNPSPSWIGRIALDPSTGEVVAIPVMRSGKGDWTFRPWLVSEDRFAWIGGSSQREIVEMKVVDASTRNSEKGRFGLNVIHTTESVETDSLPEWRRPTRPSPIAPIWKYELRLAFEIDPLDPFGEPLLYEGVAATPHRFDDWVGWVGRVKFNNNFAVRSLDGSEDGPRIFEFLMAGADHVVQRAFCSLDALSPLALPRRSDGKIDLPARTPLLDPRTERVHLN